MTIDQALHTVDELKPNQIERARKIDWISRLDKQIYRDVMLTHVRHSAEEVPDTFEGYKQDTEPDTVLLIKEPYDEIYQYYLFMQIDLANLEYDQYNNNAALFGSALGEFKRFWHRTHAPIESIGAAHQFNGMRCGTCNT